jgi:type III pantothenate kinase
MKLVMDVGNSRIKWARVGAGGPGAGTVMERSGAIESALDAAFEDAGAPSGVLIASVASEDFNARLDRWFAGRWGLRPDWFRSVPETLGVVNAYPDPAQLGADRWAAVLGARGLRSPPLAVIDCGTAVTLDVVDGDDHHLGGLIAPGLDLARRSLLTSTANVRAAAARSSGLLGRNTAECVANGTTLGLAGAVERWMKDVDERLDGVAWLATGGAWPELSSAIDRSVEYDPDLVLRGLARVLE